jgi:hypothetical protein
VRGERGWGSEKGVVYCSTEVWFHTILGWGLGFDWQWTKDVQAVKNLRCIPADSGAVLL